MQFSNGAECRNEESEQVVYLVIGIAANGHEYLVNALTKITPIIINEVISEKIEHTATAEEIINILKLPLSEER